MFNTDIFIAIIVYILCFIVFWVTVKLIISALPKKEKKNKTR